MVFVADFVALLIKQTGDRYERGHEVSPIDADPGIFDCSELVQWACVRLNVMPKMPDGSWLQAEHCRRLGTSTSVAVGVGTQGALLFRFSSDPFIGIRPDQAHVAVSLGNQSTIEARGRRYGVGSWTTEGRGWTHAAVIPGMDYQPPSPPDVHDQSRPVAPAWPGRFLMQPPVMVGADVRLWQQMMVALGWILEVDGKYGPASEKVCVAFQIRKGLHVDGIVGQATWHVASSIT